MLIAINNLRDVAEDGQTGKKTLAVRFGVGFARAEIVLLILAAHASGLYWWRQGWQGAFTLPLITLPLGLFVAWKVLTQPPGPGHNRLLAMSGAQLVAFSGLLSWAIVKAGNVMP